MDQRRPDTVVSPQGEGRPEPSRSIGLSTETIELGALFSEEVSSSGSFDLRRSRLSSIGRLFEVIPIPTLLVDESSQIVFANRACKRVAGEHRKIEGSPFSCLFPSPRDGKHAENLIDRVFHNRIPLTAEGVVGLDRITMRGRIHFRSIRIQKIRTVLVIIENITPSAQIPINVSDA
jgi:hypothetical protein